MNVENNTSQKESRVVLVFLGSLLFCSCLTLLGGGIFIVTFSEEIANALEAQAVPTTQSRRAPATPFPELPGWRTLLNDDFSAHQDIWAEGEQNNATRRFARNIKSGGYTWITTNTTTDDEWHTIPKMDAVTDFAATTTLFPQPAAEVGLVFGYLDDENYHRFLASYDGTFRIEAKRNGEWEPLLHGYADELGTEKRPRTIGVLAQDKNLEFFINDIQVAKLSKRNFIQGKIGLVLAAKAGEVITLSFDDFHVRVP